MTQLAPSAGMSQSLTLLFSVAGGMAVGNLYWVQPLLHDIGGAFHMDRIDVLAQLAPLWV